MSIQVMLLICTLLFFMLIVSAPSDNTSSLITCRRFVSGARWDSEHLSDVLVLRQSH